MILSVKDLDFMFADFFELLCCACADHGQLSFVQNIRVYFLFERKYRMLEFESSVSGLDLATNSSPRLMAFNFGL